ncbi:MAG: YbaK/EbsC family protein [Anaerolineales bacterium]|nr:YbaK/EbsC family protein [Anaerolineales bacterium]
MVLTTRRMEYFYWSNYTQSSGIATFIPMRIITGMLTTTDLQSFIEQRSISARIVHPPFPTPTVPDAARAMNVSPEAIIKSVLFVIRRTEPLLIIANGERRINPRAIAGRFNIGKKQVRIATPEQVLAWIGYPVGGVPPFGHLQPLPTWIDPAVLEQDVVYGGGGDDSVLLRMHASDLPSIVNAQLVPVCD